MKEYHRLGRGRLGSTGSVWAPPLAGARASIGRVRGRLARSADRLVGLGDGPWVHHPR
jgi:hypothetical protein